MNKLNVRRVLIFSVPGRMCRGRGAHICAWGTELPDRFDRNAGENPGGEDIAALLPLCQAPRDRRHLPSRLLVFPDTQKRAAVPFGALACEEQYCILNNQGQPRLGTAFVFEDELVRRDWQTRI